MQHDAKKKKTRKEKHTHTHILNIYIISKTYSILYIATRIKYYIKDEKEMMKNTTIHI